MNTKQFLPSSAQGSSSLNFVRTTKRVVNKISLLLTVAAFVCTGLALPASASSFTFEQTGFTGGGTITGSFTATDLDKDGSIYAAPWGDALNGYEVSQFSFSFTGDAYIPDFTSTSLGVFGYDLAGGKFLGDSPSEGIANNWFGIDGYIYASGQGPANNNGGIVIDLTSGARSVTDQLVVVSPVDNVPDNASTFMLIAGSLGVLALMRSWKRTNHEHEASLVSG